MKGAVAAAGEEARATMSLRPSQRAEVWHSCYKVAVDAEDGRRRCEDSMVEIRKSRRKESLLKKRRDDLPPSVAATAPQMAHSSALQQKACSPLARSPKSSSSPAPLHPTSFVSIARENPNPTPSRNPGLFLPLAPIWEQFPFGLEDSPLSHEREGLRLQGAQRQAQEGRCLAPAITRTKRLPGAMAIEQYGVAAVALLTKRPKSEDNHEDEPLDCQGSNDQGYSNSNTLISSIGQDNSINCVACCSRSDYGSIASLSRSFCSLVRDGELYKERQQLGIAEHWLYFSCNVQEAYDPLPFAVDGASKDAT